MSRSAACLRHPERRPLIVATIAVILLVVPAICALPELKLTRCDSANTTLDSFKVRCLPHDGVKEHEGVCLIDFDGRWINIDAQFVASEPFSEVHAFLEWDGRMLWDDACYFNLKCPSVAGQRHQYSWAANYLPRTLDRSKLVNMTFSIRPHRDAPANKGLLCVQFLAMGVRKPRQELAE